MGDIAKITGYSIQSDIEGINLVSQNVSNLQTTGFKKEHVMPRSIINIDDQISIDSHESAVSKQYDLSGGPIKVTEINTNLAILGPGFFHVKDKMGREYLTRNGEFSFDDAGYLSLKNGARLEGNEGPIRIFDKDFTVSDRGEIIQNNAATDAIPVFAIGNAIYRGNGMYDFKGASLNAITDMSIKQYALEASNVNTTDEMLKIIELTKHFNSSGKVLSAYDQMLGQSINTLGSF